MSRTIVDLALRSIERDYIERVAADAIAQSLATKEQIAAALSLGRIPVTTAARTVVDLAFFGIERDYVQRALTDAIEQRLTTLDQVEKVVERRRRSARKYSIAWLATEIDFRRRQS